MDFAKNILKKYGWEEGKGLGKKEDGINKALKPKLKFDTAGLGHDPGEQFTHKWWESAYNSAAKNLDVTNKETKVKIKKHGDIEITTKKIMKWKEQTFEEDEGRMQSSNTEDTSTATNIVQLTDEEIFAACGGLTAHKGARHGLKLSGKLRRVQEQDSGAVTERLHINKEGNKKLQSGDTSEDKTPADTTFEETTQRKRKKNKTDTATFQEQTDTTCDDAVTRKSRKSEKNKKATDSGPVESVGVEEKHKTGKSSRKRKKETDGNTEGNDNAVEECRDDAETRKSSKKRKRSKINTDPEKIEVESKENSKSKNEKEKVQNLETKSCDDGTDEVPAKSKKKKKVI